VRERVQEKLLEIASTPPLDLVSFVNPTQVTQETSHKESDTHTKEGARTTKEGATTIKKKTRNLNKNHMIRRRSGLIRRACTLALILLLH
jgi:hypothetical protein